MYLNLDPSVLGISGRQSELIELALTYGFKGLDLDVIQLARQVDLHGYEHATRYIESAGIRIGVFDLSVRWQGGDGEFQEDLERLAKLGEIVARLGTTGCRTVVMPASDELPYHENFEFHRQRFTKIAEVLAPHSLRLGLDFLASATHREEKKHQFIHSPDALVTLAKTVGVSNVGISVDTWQWQVAGASWDSLRELTADEIVSVRASDLPQGVTNDTVDDEQRVLTSSQGNVDIQSILQQLSSIGYEGPITPFPHSNQFSGTKRDTIVRMAAESVTMIETTSSEVEENIEDSVPVAVVPSG